MFIPESVYKDILENLPILCVDLLIIYDGKCLLLERNTEPAKGQYWFPGGRINKMELIKDASLRKAKEETNLNCEFKKILTVEESIFKNIQPVRHTVNICCLLHTSDISELIIDKFHDKYIWVNSQNDNYHPAVNHPLSLLNM